MILQSEYAKTNDGLHVAARRFTKKAISQKENTYLMQSTP
jgi:hypothetical protein